MVRNITSVTALAVAATLMTTSISWAGSDGRRNTALATTALAIGAWSNHTGKAGRKNTAILATAGAALAWGRYHNKKRQENRQRRYFHVAARPAPVAWVQERPQCAPPCAPVACVAPPQRVVYVQARPEREECRENPGRHLGWYKHEEHHGHHHGDDDDDRDEDHHGHHGHHGHGD